MKKQRGITLVALVITIIILIILAGISFSVLFGEDGLIAKAQNGSQRYKREAEVEQNTINDIESFIKGDYVPSESTSSATNAPKIKAWTETASTDFHYSSIKNSITQIEFVDLNQKQAPGETTIWDVSANEDNSVKAWLEGTKLYIGGIGGVKANEDSSYIFYDFPNVTSISFGNKYNTSEVTNMSWMFANSPKIESLNLSNFNTANVTNMQSMFAGSTTNHSQCKMALTQINTSSFNTSNVTDMSAMFWNCGELAEIDVTNFDTRNVTTMEDMFNGPNDFSSKVKVIKLGSNFDTSNVENMIMMFADLSSCGQIIVRKEFNFKSGVHTDDMFTGSENLIGGNGTWYTSSHVDDYYAKIDKKNQPGYFTDYRTGLENNNTELEYIESTGTQYIATNIIPADTMGVYLKIASTNTSSDLTYFGSRKTTNTRFWIANEDDKVYYGWNTNTPNGDMPSISENTDVELELNYKNSRKSKFNSTIIDNLSESLSSSNDVAILIFAAKDDWETKWRAEMKLYSLKISDGSNDIHNFVPAYNSIVDDYGLYDTIENRFYGNSGSGTFGHGNVKSN